VTEAPLARRRGYPTGAPTPRGRSPKILKMLSRARLGAGVTGSLKASLSESARHGPPTDCSIHSAQAEIQVSDFRVYQDLCHDFRAADLPAVEKASVLL